MNSELHKEDILMQVREHLRSKSIKLWQSPYYVEEKGSSMDHLHSLSEEFSNALDMPADGCLEALMQLQRHSLDNLKHTLQYKTSGLATLKIRLMGKDVGGVKIFNLEITLDSTGLDLKRTISLNTQKPNEQLKLISAGKVLRDNETLSIQGITNGQQIMAIFLEGVAANDENKYKVLDRVKSDSRLLASDSRFMAVEDQFGNTVKLDPEDRKALIVAMALHEKGRAAIKRNDYSNALLFFLESEHEFHQCINVQLLDSVDNYALLDMDIAWCYLMLQSMAHLPEAYERLERCEKRFDRTYGPNLERLKAVKGRTGNEAPLFMRLHLMQAIALYHKNRRSEALQLLRKAQTELNALKVDDNNVSILMEMGFTAAEARLGLRASDGDVNIAANYIKDKRDQRAESRRKAAKEEKEESRITQYGLCDDGVQYVDANNVKILTDMGYSKDAAKVALKHSNNVISDAVQYISENSDLIPAQSRSTEVLAMVESLESEILAAGFKTKEAKRIVSERMSEFIELIDTLSSGGMLMDDAPSSSSSSTGQSDYLKNKLMKALSKERRNAQAYQRLAEDISTADDDHLDFTLEQEELLLLQYLSLLE